MLEVKESILKGEICTAKADAANPKFYFNFTGDLCLIPPRGTKNMREQDYKLL
jgi:hypothetical protein